MMILPVTTPCAHNFCKGCLEGVFTGQTFLRECTSASGRSLRTRKNVMRCPACENDIAEFLQNPQVNRDLQMIIETLQKNAKTDKHVDEQAAVEEEEAEGEEEEEEENAGSEGGGDDEESDGNDGEKDMSPEMSESPSKRANVEAGEEKADTMEETVQPQQVVTGNENAENE